ncbi:hypothetical protein AgCh_032636 [Apium graveolens]
MGEANANSTYLGLPNMLGRNKSTILGYLKDMVCSQVNKWNGKCISRSGKEVLIKTAVQALPTYAMSLFLLPQDITKHIEKTLASYWWKTSQNSNSWLNWMCWERMTRHKSLGGMGFRDFRDFNIAMLGKQGWRLATNPNNLVTRVYKARDQGAILDTVLNDNGGEDVLYWKYEAPPKAINVVWRALSNCLPTLSQLQLKRVQVNAICPVCHEDNESILHSLVHCSYARLCWSLTNVDTQVGLCSDFKSWLEIVMSVADAKKQVEISTICWALWRNRNDLVWNQRHASVYKTVAAAKQYLSQWSLAQNRSTSALLQPAFEGDGACIWVNPQHNSVKISADAAVFEDKDAVGFGLIARDSNGVLIQAKSIVHKSSVSPVLAEAMAIKEALSWIDEMHWKECTVVSDCLVVVQAIRSKTPMRSQFGSVIEECRSQLRRLNKVSLYHVKRSANMVAHQLARESHSYPDRSFNRDTIPVSVNSCIEMDLNNL